MDSAKYNLMLLVVLLLLSVHGWKETQAQVHHVVGDDRGWDLASDIASWAAGRTFTVGDFLWFAYSDGVDKDKVVELRTKEEMESCDLANPILIFTQGIDKVSLPAQGHRYFASSNIESCKQGLKLPVEVKSKTAAAYYQSLHPLTTKNAAFLAQEPSALSSSTRICGSIIMLTCLIIFTVLLF
ncbi:umecyanin-like [Silene latifolia]|uniref:umecyanin-like n=1 Tax=Silene latifolia TaxID=37657 RepID=UPI003D789CC9